MRAREETHRSAAPKTMPFKGIFKLLNGIEVKSANPPSLFQCRHPAGEERPHGPPQSQAAKLDAPVTAGLLPLSPIPN